MEYSKQRTVHLLHPIGSHHGEYECGSPVLPRTPEAFALHYIDNPDTKLELVRHDIETFGPGPARPFWRNFHSRVNHP